MIPNEKGHEAESEGREAMPEGRGRWHYLAVKKTISIIERNNF